jgi:hypothetical protein
MRTIHLDLRKLTVPRALVLGLGCVLGEAGILLPLLSYGLWWLLLGPIGLFLLALGIAELNVSAMTASGKEAADGR